MRSAAQIEPLALRIDLDGVAFGDRVDELDLVALAHVAEHLLCRLALHGLAGERRVALDDLAHLRFDLRQILGRERFLAREVVIEPILDHGTDGDLRTGIEFLHRLGHHMRRVVTNEFERLGIGPRDDADVGVLFDRLVEIAQFAVDRHRHGLLRKRFGDGSGNVETRDSGFEVACGTVGKL